MGSEAWSGSWVLWQPRKLIFPSGPVLSGPFPFLLEAVQLSRVIQPYLYMAGLLH